MNFLAESFNHAMDAIQINGTIKTKLWKSRRNFGSPDETLEDTVYHKICNFNMAASYKQHDSLIREIRNLRSSVALHHEWPTGGDHSKNRVEHGF
jgi:hypothetical protein